MTNHNPIKTIYCTAFNDIADLLKIYDTPEDRIKDLETTPDHGFAITFDLDVPVEMAGKHLSCLHVAEECYANRSYDNGSVVCRRADVKVQYKPVLNDHEDDEDIPFGVVMAR